MKKKLYAATALLLAAACLLSGCKSDTLRMSLEKIGESVVYNQSMVGVGGEISDHIRSTIVFDNDDPDKMKYITNNIYSDSFDITDDVTIEEGIYYDSFLNLKGVDYARGVIVFLEFASSDAASEALSVIQGDLNFTSNSDGTCDLEYGEAVQNKNVICVIVTYEPNAYLELKRVFLDNSYVH